MANNVPLNLRIKFKKVGNLQYISHLDLVRTMQKIVVRTKLPVWYTEGFNPKPKMVFAAPLSTGTESLVEFMDLRLDSEVSLDEAVAAFNFNMTDEMQVLEVYYPATKLTELKWMKYTMRIKTEGADEALALSIEKALSCDTIEVKKKTKPGEPEKFANIAPLIKYASASFIGGEIVISACLSGDQSSFLNPEYVIKALIQSCGILSANKPLSEYYSIMREGAFCEDMSAFK